jgi:hypothetical protein
MMASPAIVGTVPSGRPRRDSGFALGHVSDAGATDFLEFIAAGRSTRRGNA